MLQEVNGEDLKDRSNVISEDVNGTVDEEGLGADKQGDKDDDFIITKGFILPYIRLIIHLSGFRLLWFSNVVSLLGDWLNELACLRVLTDLSNSTFLVSLFLISRELPPLVCSPFAGVVADIYDRRRIMFVADIARMFIVLGFLLVRSKESLWLLYVLALSQFVLTSFFTPAVESLIPQLVPSRLVGTANITMNITWSFLLMSGAGLGGIVTYLFGTTFNFAIDSLTYLLSAFFISRLMKVTLREDEAHKENKLAVQNTSFFRNYVDGLSFLWQNKYFLVIALGKASGSAIWAAVEVALVKFATVTYVIKGDSSLPLGIIYLSSGVGVACGPVILNRFLSGNDKSYRIGIVVGMLALTSGTLMEVFDLPFPLFLLSNAWRTFGSSCVWIYSSTLLQRAVPNHLLGRVSAFELAALTFAAVCIRLAYSYLVDSYGIPFARALLPFGLFGVVLCILWIAFVSWKNKQEEFQLLSTQEETVQAEETTQENNETESNEVNDNEE